MDKTTILFVEDDMALAMGTIYSLEGEDYEVIHARCFLDVQKLWKENKGFFDCVLLDVMLPDKNGYEICQWIKEQSTSRRIPVIFLSALEDEGNVVHGLEIGGDDYIAKPYRMKELVARINANVRKYHTDNNMSIMNIKTINDETEIKLDEERYCVWKNGEKISLTLSEFRLLRVLMQNTGKVMTRDILMEQLWSIDEAFVDDNTLSVYIRRIREKIDDGEESHIQTIRGVGYSYRKGVEDDKIR